MKLVNLGKSGVGNSFIAQRINEYIIENHKKIGLVCVLWSGWERISFYNYEGYNVIPCLFDRTISNDINKHSSNQSISKQFLSLLDQFNNNVKY